MALNTHSIDLERGSSQYLSVANTAGVFDLTTGTIECWVKVESFQAGTERPEIMSTQNTNAGFILRLNRDDIDHKVEFYINEANQAISTTELTVGTWFHIAATWDTSERNIYINGSLEDTDGTDSTLAAGAATLTIGGAGNYFDGLIDDIRIWNTKRTGTEINNNKDVQLTGSESGLLAYWQLDNALTDSTSGARTLTNNGSAVFSTDHAFMGSFPASAVTLTATLPTSTVVIGIPVSALALTATLPSLAAKGAGDWANTQKNSATMSNLSKS